MRVPEREERTGDRNVKFVAGFAADRAVMRRATAPAGSDKPRDDFTGNA